MNDKENHIVKDALIIALQENSIEAKRLNDLHQEKMNLIQNAENRMIRMYLELNDLPIDSKIEKNESGYFVKL